MQAQVVQPFLPSLNKTKRYSNVKNYEDITVLEGNLINLRIHDCASYNSISEAIIFTSLFYNSFI